VKLHPTGTYPVVIKKNIGWTAPVNAVPVACPMRQRTVVARGQPRPNVVNHGPPSRPSSRESTRTDPPGKRQIEASQAEAGGAA